MSDSLDYDQMSLQDFVNLQRTLDRELRRRFERTAALVFTDVVGSTAYIARYGDVAGRALLQRHHDLLREALEGSSGRVVDTAGDGAFCVAGSAEEAAAILIRLQNLILRDNAEAPAQDHLSVRSGLHWGRVLTDGDLVTGEAVHAAARLAAEAAGAEILLSRAAAALLPHALSARTLALPIRSVKGLPTPIEPLSLDWREPELHPSLLSVVETRSERVLPLAPRVTVGRLPAEAGAAHVAVSLRDPAATQRVSRRHIALTLRPDGYALEVLSRAPTTLNGEPLEPGATVRVEAGDEIGLSRVVTLQLRPHGRRIDRDQTML